MRNTFFRLSLIGTSLMLIAFMVRIPAAPYFRNSVTLHDMPYRESPAESEVSIVLVFSQNAYRLKESISMDISILCRSGRMMFTNAVNQFENYRFTVYDQNNNRVYESYTYTLWRNNELAKTSGSDRIITIAEGETFTAKIDLTAWFTFERPGTYRIEGVFNPTPADDADERFSMPTSTAYLTVDAARRVSRTESSKKSKTPSDGVYADVTPSASAPYDVISEHLDALKAAEWDVFYRNMHMPSIIMTSIRYRERFESMFGENKQSFTDAGLEARYDESDLTNFLRSEFNDTNDLLLTMMATNYGFRAMRDYVNAYKVHYIADPDFLRDHTTRFRDDYVSHLALRYEMEYRTSLPKDRARIFDEYKRYLACRYDRNIRRAYLLYLDEKAYKGARTGEGFDEANVYYASTASNLRKEFAADDYYVMHSFDIRETTVKTVRGLKSAFVKAVIVQSFHSPGLNHEKHETITRQYTLRKLGDYWYIVDYYDTLGER